MLDAVGRQLLSDGFELDTIKAISEDRWEAWAFKPGHLIKLKDDVKRFKRMRVSSGLGGVN